MQAYMAKRQVLHLNRKTSKSSKSGISTFRIGDKMGLKKLENLKSEVKDSNMHLERVRHFSISKKGQITHQFDTVQHNDDYQHSLDDKIQKDEVDCLMQTPRYRVAVYGSPYTGKTSLIHQMTTSESIEGYDINGLLECTVPVVLDDKKTHIQFIECESYLRYSRSFTNYDAFLMVYSITDRRSFQCIVSMVRKLRNKYGCTKPIILVVNKSDLVRRRSICIEDGKLLARGCKCKYIETSVPLQWNVDKVLVAVTRQLQLYNDLQVNNLEDAQQHNESSTKSKKTYSPVVTFFKRIFGRKLNYTESFENILKL